MKLIRDKENEFGTFGTLILPNSKILSTLEPQWMDNQANISCIPAGSYQCSITQSPRYGKVYEVKDVPNRSHILFHSGNWAKDTQGCILLGLAQDGVRLFESRKAVAIFMQLMNKQPFELEIKWKS